MIVKYYFPVLFPPRLKVVRIELDKEKQTPYGLTFDTYHHGFKTGWIDIEIETVTPLYIRGVEKESGSKDKKEQTPDFFKPTGKPAIPGSSLRGMIRQMVEIVSYGKFGFFDEKKTLYYRGLADRSNLRKEYQDKMSSYDRYKKISLYNVSAGIIKKEGLSYFIIPTDYTRITKLEAQREVESLNQKDMDEKYKEFEFYDLEGSPKFSQYYLVVSGDMNNKKHDWLVKKSASGSGKKIPIPNRDILNYKNDKTRQVLTDKKGNEIPSILNLIELLDKDIHKEVPCFYVKCQDERQNKGKDEERKERCSFGHTAMFRLAYEKSVGDHVPEELTAYETCDTAGSIFGNESSFAGRVFFEDALIDRKHDNEEINLGEKHHKILSEPKPTTFQHYLVQKDDELKNMRHYNSNSLIRGNKLYWHKEGKDWAETDNEQILKHPKQYKSKINPIKPGVGFTGRIRFENLSDIELGALLFSLDLPNGCFHKIGMGKSLGLGTIKITPTLYISKRTERYEKLFSEWNNQIANPTAMNEFIRNFEKHTLQEVGEKESEILWRTDRLQNLLVMLYYDKGVKLDQQKNTDYMDLQDFKNRSILPKPSQLMDAQERTAFYQNMWIEIHKKKKPDNTIEETIEPGPSPTDIKKI